MQVADGQKGQNQAGSMSDPRSRRSQYRMKKRLDDLEYRFLAGPAQSEAAEGHTDLRYRKQAGRVGEQV